MEASIVELSVPALKYIISLSLQKILFRRYSEDTPQNVKNEYKKKNLLFGCCTV